MKNINKYIFFARYIPGAITILPVTIIYFFVTKNNSELDLKAYLESFTFLFGVSMSFIISYFISSVVSEFGNFLENKYFEKKLTLPTNYLMLYENSRLPLQTKKMYCKKILNDFGIKILKEQEEVLNKTEALKALQQASKILSTKYQQNQQIKDANISYGFSRNLSGGLFISLPVSLIGILIGIIYKENTLIIWTSTLTFIYGLITLFHKKWIISNAEKYAEKLFAVYLIDK